MFKNKIDYWIREKGLVVKYVAGKCNVSEQTLYSWRKNKTQPDLEHAFILAKVFNISIEDLCDYDET